MLWTDVNDIAIELSEAHPDVDPLALNFVDLRNWVMQLADFDDDPDLSLIHISEPTRQPATSRMPSSA